MGFSTILPRYGEGNRAAVAGAFRLSDMATLDYPPSVASRHVPVNGEEMV